MIDQKKALVNEPSSPLELARMIFDLAEHGDYSNGNVAQGMDEGQVLASDMLRQYETRLQEFEHQSVSRCPSCGGDGLDHRYEWQMYPCAKCSGAGVIHKELNQDDR